MFYRHREISQFIYFEYKIDKEIVLFVLIVCISFREKREEEKQKIDIFHSNWQSMLKVKQKYIQI